MKNKALVFNSGVRTGFTLLEVMLALLVVSLGLVALVQSAQQGATATATNQHKTAAYHVADQVMLQLYQRRDLSDGKHQGQETFGGQTYYWQAVLSNTDNERINRIDLVVGSDRQLDYADAQLTGFKKR